MSATKGVGVKEGVWQMFTLADEEGRGVWQMRIFADKGGGGSGYW